MILTIGDIYKVYNIEELLSDYNLFYYISSVNFIEKQKGLSEIIKEINEGTCTIGKFDGYIIFKSNNKFKRVDIELLQAFMDDISHITSFNF